MSTQNLIKKIAHETEISEAKVELIIRCLLYNIKKSLAEGEDLTFRNFGSFQRVRRLAKRGYNLKAQETMQIPERWGVKFSIGQGFKAMVRK